MSTASADPELLRTFAAHLQRHADGLLVDVSTLGAAEAALSRACTCQATDPLAPPVVVDELRAIARRLVTLAEDTDRVGRAFRAADARRRTSGTVTVSDDALAGAVLGADPTRSLFNRLRRSSSAARHAVLSELDRGILDALVAWHPDWVGSADGVPWPLRTAANHRLVLRALGVARRAGRPRTVQVLERLATCQVLSFDARRGRFAVLHGDLDDAANVAVFVPGMKSSFDQFFHGGASTDDKAGAIYQEARRRSHRPTAVIAWLGYHAPMNLPSAAVTTDASNGGRLLRRFVEGLRISPTKRLTLVGHSYGTVTIGQALAQGLHVDELVVAGSPGIGVDHARDLSTHVTDVVSVLAAPGDPVARFGAFGREPGRPSFGARRLAVNAPGRGHTSGHAHYFTPGSESVRNIAAVVVGAAVEIQTPSGTDRAVDLIDEGVERAAGLAPIERMARGYRGPGSDAVHEALRVHQDVPGQAGRFIMDGIDHLVP